MNGESKIGPHGEGIGGKVELTPDPDNPTYDPATKWGTPEKRIMALLSEPVVGKLNQFEKHFLIDVYSQPRLTRKQHILLHKIFKTHEADIMKQ